jgi:hypothetical protein
MIGLIWFCVIGFGTPPILLLDRWLDVERIGTITAYCRANPWAAYLVLMLLASGLFGLAMHFMNPVPVVWNKQTSAGGAQ